MLSRLADPLGGHPRLLSLSNLLSLVPQTFFLHLLPCLLSLFKTTSPPRLPMGYLLSMLLPLLLLMQGNSPLPSLNPVSPWLNLAPHLLVLQFLCLLILHPLQCSLPLNSPLLLPPHTLTHNYQSPPLKVRLCLRPKNGPQLLPSPRLESLLLFWIYRPRVQMRVWDNRPVQGLRIAQHPIFLLEPLPPVPPRGLLPPSGLIPLYKENKLLPLYLPRQGRC
uniref:Uncharacterized protein n=1 Tax=Cacopsylla melanoneura TaxID=428564 RepID=A0A8D8QDB8_9HEMI